jgi:N-acetylglucosamine kinase-like BadF-type ATPase
VLFKAAELGDGRALQIVWGCVREVLKITDRFAVELFSDGRSFRLVLDGAVFRGGYEVLLTMIKLAVEARYQAEIIVPSTPPVAGALYLAYERAGIPLTAELLNTVKNSFPKEAISLEN